MLGLMTTVLAQGSTSGGDMAAGAAGGIVALIMGMVFWTIFMLVYLAVVLAITGPLMWWKVFEKAGALPWHSVVPFYNVYILFTKVAFKPGWWAFLLVASALPLLGILAALAFIVCMILASLSVAKNFGKDTGFAVGLILLGIVFYPILGFGDSKWQPTAGSRPPLPA